VSILYKVDGVTVWMGVIENGTAGSLWQCSQILAVALNKTRASSCEAENGPRRGVVCIR